MICWLSLEELSRLANWGMRRMLQPFKPEVFIYQSNANIDLKVLFNTITQHLSPESNKILAKLYGKENAAFPYWSMIYLALKYSFNVIVICRHRIYFSLASKLWTRIGCGLLVPMQILYQRFLALGSKRWTNLPNKSFASKLANDW